MLEGLPPNDAAHVMRLRCEEQAARRIADLFVETFDPAEVAAAAFEEEPRAEARNRWWLVEVYFQRPPDQQVVKDLLLIVAGPEAAAAASFERVGEQDWIASSLEGLRPVEAGRFLIHGAHDRRRAGAHALALEIEAALAFGTGHHGTTRGCLLLLDHLLKRRKPQKILDLGAGTGVLAMAAAKALKRGVACADIDPVAVEAARENARKNALSAFLRPVVSRGLASPTLRAGAPYDLIFANILAGPLRLLAPSLGRVAGRPCELILSGLLERDRPGVLSAYRAQGFFLREALSLEGWVSLLLRRASDRP